MCKLGNMLLLLSENRDAANNRATSKTNLKTVQFYFFLQKPRRSPPRTLVKKFEERSSNFEQNSGAHFQLESEKLSQEVKGLEIFRRIRGYSGENGEFGNFNQNCLEKYQNSPETRIFQVLKENLQII
ncbi:hypothetical protein Y032_1151g3697 [Ancylostoma ceylanicum]|uniref:Uncharacterized protein n=2 Tax=Ancylostoma ceylanicum TaxID=53326 RepID=A0A016W654_9BILA|nr:hypothetical protein Y032_1151g3697 [Ancylostoma ceylanicum]